MRLTIDFETRSQAGIDLGSWRYAEDPSTEALMLAALPDDGRPPVLWMCDHFLNLLGDYGTASLFGDNDFPLVTKLEIMDLVNQAETITAFNAGFERSVWHHCLHRRLGWPDLPLEKLRCSSAKAARSCLPRSLDKVAEVLGLKHQKDKAGHALMLRMCKPCAPAKAQEDLVRERLREVGSPLAGGTWAAVKAEYARLQARGAVPPFWHEDPQDIVREGRYCIQDVVVEQELDQLLPDLTPQEQRVWQWDQGVNARGVCIDTEIVQTIVQVVAEFESGLDQRMHDATDGIVPDPRKLDRLKAWLKTQDVEVGSLDKEAIEYLLPRVPEHVRAVLELRQHGAKSSVAKFMAMLDRACTDSRARDLFRYHGAGTGRWAGQGIQVHNLPRDSYKPGMYEAAADLFFDGDLDAIEMLLAPPPYAASRCVRGSLIAGPGKDFICADFSAIEGRGLAWLAGEEWVLDAYRAYDRGEGPDMYYINASKTLGKPVEEVSKKERNEIGKPGELGGGYGGGPNAIRNFMYPGHPLMALDDEELREKIVTPWRNARPNIVSFWYGLEASALAAVRDPGKVYSYRGVGFVVRAIQGRAWLFMRLPSGRLLWYFRPSVKPATTSWGEEKDAVHYWGLKQRPGTTSVTWCEISTYGGKLAENVTQAVCRDILAEAALRVEAAGYPVVLHVHDELVSEVDDGTGDLARFCEIMTEAPTWAPGMPIAAAGWVGKRYRKD